MNRLSIEEREHILRLLGDGMSIRSIAALTGVSKNTVANLMVDAGNACANYHDANVRGVKAARVDVTEIWSFAHAKRKTGASAKAAPYCVNDAWLRVASAADSKLIVSYRIGTHDAESAGLLIADLETRLAHPFYSNAVLAGIVGSLNVTSQTATREAAQAADAFIKKVRNHASAVAFHIVCHNFVGICEAGATPAMIAGISDRPLEFREIAMLVEQAIDTPSKRGSYKKSF